MARESQGLQIALIIFVMLAVVLGVTTFLFHGRYTEALKAAKDSDAAASKAKTEAANKETDCAELRRMIGLADKSVNDIREQFDKDMKAYATNFPEDSRFYAPVLGRLWETIDSRSKEVVALNLTIQDLDTKYKNWQKSKDATVVKFEAVAADQGVKVAAVEQEARDQRDTLQKTQRDLTVKLGNVMRGVAAKIDEANVRAKEAETIAANAEATIRAERKTINDMLPGSKVIPSGEITWVNQASRMVWINLGAADRLQRQMSFSVYSGETNELGGKAAKKATIEVTKIQGDHQAEAKILDEVKISDPIMPGDKIHTPLWSPGEQVHYALCGIMDLDGDGQNQVSTLDMLILRAHGVVDATLDEHGKRTGEMSAKTNFIVLGSEPKGELLSPYTKMVAEADHLNIPKIQLSDLKQKMGYKRSASVERFGRAPAPDARKAAAATKGGAGKRRPAKAEAEEK